MHVCHIFAASLYRWGRILRLPDAKMAFACYSSSSISSLICLVWQQRCADWEIFQSQSTPDPMKLNPIQSWSAKFLKIISPIQSWSANVNLCIFVLPHGAKELYWIYFAFSQIRLVEGKIVPEVLLPHEVK